MTHDWPQVEDEGPNLPWPELELKELADRLVVREERLTAHNDVWYEPDKDCIAAAKFIRKCLAKGILP